MRTSGSMAAAPRWPSRIVRLSIRMNRIGTAIAGSLLSVVLSGCNWVPSKSEVRKQLEQHEAFAQPVVWYLGCFGTQTKKHEAECFSGLDAQAKSLALTASADLRVQRMLLKDGSPTWVPSDRAQSATESGGKPVVGMIAPNGQRGWIPGTNVEAAKKAGMRLDDDPNIDDDEPVFRVDLTDKGRKLLREPGSIVKENELGFVVARRTVLSLTKFVRLGPDSVSAEFQWRAVPTEAGILFKPTFGISTHTAKALFRLDNHKDWKLIDPHSWESDDPQAKEFDLYEQTKQD